MRADGVKTSEEIRSARDINDDPDEDLEPEGDPGDKGVEEGDEEGVEDEDE